jgi:hypothetical protein
MGPQKSRTVRWVHGSGDCSRKGSAHFFDGWKHHHRRAQCRESCRPEACCHSCAPGGLAPRRQWQAGRSRDILRGYKHFMFAVSTNWVRGELLSVKVSAPQAAVLSGTFLHSILWAPDPGLFGKLCPEMTRIRIFALKGNVSYSTLSLEKSLFPSTFEHRGSEPSKDSSSFSRQRAANIS